MRNAPLEYSTDALLCVVANVVKEVTEKLPSQSCPPPLHVEHRNIPTRRRSRRTPLVRDDVDCIEVDGRLGKALVTGKAAEVLKTWSPSVFCFPPMIPIKEEIVIGGRRWIVKDTTLGMGLGYGLFACEAIDVPHNLGSDMQYAPALFPYAGPVYTSKAWKLLVHQHPSWRVYQLDMDCWPGSHKKKEHTRTIDGDPVRFPNVAGYINSTKGTKPKKIPNVEWVTVGGTPPPPFNGKCVDDHIMTVAIRPIRAGEELFCDYDWTPT